MINAKEFEETPPRPLTAIERDVLWSLATGKEAKEIAIERRRSWKTIRSQLVSIYRKLGAINAPHAVAIGFREGLLQ